MIGKAGLSVFGRLVAVALAGLLWTAGARADALTGYEPLTDWSSLSRAKTGVTAGLISSYDRLGANEDFNWYQSPDGRQRLTVPTVVATLTGPGVLRRFWMPHATADVGFTLKMTIDGQVRIDTNTGAFLGGQHGYVNGPLVGTVVGGQVCYEPIAFGQSLVIESNNSAAAGWAPQHHYYQYNYQLLPSGTDVAAYTGSLSPAQQSARAAATAMVAAVGANPAGAASGAVTLATGATELAAGQSLRLGRAFGSGRIRRLNVSAPGLGDAQLDSLRLRVRFDGSSTWSVDVPVSHFFGAGHERAPYQSLPLGTAGDEGFYCYWPMPYRQEAVVELYNAGDSALAFAGGTVEYEPAALGPDECHFGATYREQTTVAGQTHYQLLDLQGAGHYVGNMMYVRRNSTVMDILEGDDIVTVDGERTLYGTGLEDAYNGGYYYNHVLVQDDDGDVRYPDSGTGPFSGLLHLDNLKLGDSFVRADQYRWLIGDCVPFTTGINVRNENYGLGADVLYGSTAFYYLQAGDAPLPGDATGDGTINIGDLGVLAANWGRAGMTWLEGEFTGDGLINVGDLGVLAANWGRSRSMTSTDPLPPGPTVPEPTSLGLLALGAVLLRRRA